MKISFALALVLLNIASVMGDVYGQEKTPETSAQGESERNVAGHDGSFFIQSRDGRFRLNFSGFIHSTGEVRVNEAASDVATFRLKRARFRLFGHLFVPEVQYAFEYELATNKLTNTYVQWTAWEALSIKFGNIHVPFDIETLTPTTRLQFVDRSIFYSYFGIPELFEPGLTLHGKARNATLGYAVGAYNGEGINTANQNTEFRYAARLFWNSSGERDAELVDFPRSQSPEFIVSVAGMFNDTPDPSTVPAGATQPIGEMKLVSATTDFRARYKGIGVSGAYAFGRIDRDIGATTLDHGYLFQGGWLLPGTDLELAARTARIFIDGGNNSKEYTFGLNVYFFSNHAVKLQTDFSLLGIDDKVAPGNDQTDYRARAQLQIMI